MSYFFKTQTAVRVARFATTMCVLLMIVNAAHAQLRMVSYNTAGGPRASMDTVLEQIGLESVNGVAKPIDVLMLQEQASGASTTQDIVNILNTIYSGNPNAVYARATLDGGSSGSGSPGLIYNTQAVALELQQAIGTVSTSGQARQVMRYRLQPIGYDDDAEFYVYNSHMKAGSSSSDQNRRAVETSNIRLISNGHTAGTNFIYAGDFNMQSSAESAYQNLIAPGNGQGIDPINSPGQWNNNNAFRAVHTQSPISGSGTTADGLVRGGMDDRFDFQLISQGLNDGEGLAYIANSYHAFGNDGSQPLNGSITQSGGANATARAALQTASDHLPVVVDYQLPADMDVSVASVPSQVIVGASANVNVTVSNGANVVAAIGADELDFTVSGTGDLTGGGSGTDAALGGGQLRTLAIDTTTAGQKTGNAQVNSSSQAAVDATFSQPVAVDVLDHADASFADGTDTNFLQIDFGTVTQNTVVSPIDFDIHNREGTAGFTADLEAVLSSTTLGDTGVLMTDMASFDALEAGASLSFSALFDTSTLGEFSATYTLLTFDENLPGALQGDSLVLHLIGEVTVGVVPEPTSLLAMVGVLGLCYRRRVR